MTNSFGIVGLSRVNLRAALVLTVLTYALAASSAFLVGIKAPILDGVPLCGGATLLFVSYARLFFPRAYRLHVFIEAVFVTVGLGLCLACLSYAGAAVGMPLRDMDIVRIDRYLDFDWLRMMMALDRRPSLLLLLDAAYATFTAQLIGAALILLVGRRIGALDRYFVTFACASILAEALSVLVPTLGPMSTVAAEAHFIHLPTIGRTTAEIVLSLREKSLASVDLDAINGIISFPSVHAAVAIVVPYTLRYNKFIFWPVALLDAIMLASAVPSGNHYLADVIAGVGVAILAIAAAGTAEKWLLRAAGCCDFVGKQMAGRPITG